ncbi:hypothetical protein H4R99_004674 [Coemansia sp. RSA 1722]|nr:hypothetical protein LPJ57_004060 [Coemansia sp. RSA 486]KAJ2233660.1 hypothetical protein IWW45_004007 [Coemansia sp. RSA 485]KAJ2594749.1 hypothetical protein GGF39_004097 [Coemansia sp. RSA 1721]KAJ2597014.1 hypothetical protein H4R99_004674 [Coemansia sp. RSA 1722]
MAENPETPTTSRYSLRTRTPAKAPEPPATAPIQQTPRKRNRPAETSSKSTTKAQSKTRARASSTPTAASRRRPGTSSRRTSTSTRKHAVSTKDGSDEDQEEAEISSEDEDYVTKTNKSAKHEATPQSASGSVVTPRRGPGRPRKDSSTKGRVDDGVSRKSWDIRRMPVHLTKHDPFKVENLFEAMRIMQQIPANGTLNDDRYELMKMSDALKMCGYELGVVYSDTEAVNEVYRMLSWAVHAAGPNGPSHQAPQLSEDAKKVLLRVFASAGRRIREETKDMAGYHRRHALRKLMLAKATKSESVNDENGDGDGEARMKKEQLVHRRNPLKIPGPLVDIWREPYKKSNENEGNESHASDN